jgi:hypothetical protein
MRYYRKPLFKPLEEVDETAKPLLPWQVARLIGSLNHELENALLRAEEECTLDDGRKQWMVSYPKYTRLKALNKQLRRENENLRKLLEERVSE